jgi:hypothetical protein
MIEIFQLKNLEKHRKDKFFLAIPCAFLPFLPFPFHAVHESQTCTFVLLKKGYFSASKTMKKGNIVIFSYLILKILLWFLQQFRLFLKYFGSPHPLRLSALSTLPFSCRTWIPNVYVCVVHSWHCLKTCPIHF